MALQLHMVERRHGVTGNPHEQPRSRHAQHVSRGVPKAQVSLNQHGPGTSRSACAALRIRLIWLCPPGARRCVALLCASPLARTAAAQRAPLAGLTSAATPAQHCACSAACTAAHTSLTRVLCPSFRSAQSELLYVMRCLAAVRAFRSCGFALCAWLRGHSLRGSLVATSLR